MEQTLLIELIQALSPEERTQIKEFAQLSFINHGPHRAKVILFLDLCLNHPWEDSSSELDKKSLHTALYPEQDFKQWRLEHVMVEAHKIVRTFLGMKHYSRDENEFHQTLDFSRIVHARGLKTRYKQLLSRLQKIQEASEHKSLEYYLRQFLLESEIYNEESLNNQKKGDLNIPNVLKTLDTFSYLRRFALLNAYLLQQKVTNLDTPDYIQFYLDQSVVPESYLIESPVLKINYEIFNIFKKGLPEINDIQGLFKLVLENEKNLDGESLQEFYAYLRNFSVLLLTKDPERTEIKQTLHELYLDNLSRGYLHYNGKLSPSRYRAVINNALEIGLVEWANTFIEDYKDALIGENESRDFYRFNKAHYFFVTGQFEECLDCLPATSSFADYLLLGKRLELKALYELKSELLPYKLDAFRMFIGRTSQKLLSDALIKINLDLVNALLQLTNVKPGDLKRAERIYERFAANKQLLERHWLLEKAKALKGKA